MSASTSSKGARRWTTAEERTRGDALFDFELVERLFRLGVFTNRNVHGPADGITFERAPPLDRRTPCRARSSAAGEIDGGGMARGDAGERQTRRTAGRTVDRGNVKVHVVIERLSHDAVLELVHSAADLLTDAQVTAWLDRHARGRAPPRRAHRRSLADERARVPHRELARPPLRELQRQLQELHAALAGHARVDRGVPSASSRDAWPRVPRAACERRATRSS